jgi:hypothetical protein
LGFGVFVRDPGHVGMAFVEDLEPNAHESVARLGW